MNEFFKFKSYFDDLVDSAYSTYLGLSCFPKTTFARVLIKEIEKAMALSCSRLSIEYEDISQELSCMWIYWIKRYREMNCGHSSRIRIYLLRRSVWGLRDWFKDIVLAPQHDAKYGSIDPGFRLDQSFLIYGSSDFPFSDLSSFERYIIYLKFVEDKSILQMSVILSMDKKDISKQFGQLMARLRRMIDA